MLEMSQLTKKELLQGVEGVISSKKLARNTVSYRLADGTECIKYHDTVVIKKSPDGVVTLNSGGFHTVTTKSRFSEYGYIEISQKNGIWYMPDGSAYYDGIQVTVSPINNPKTYRRDIVIVSEVKQSNDAVVKAMKKRIVKYAALITKDNLPAPQSGDCWFCLMKTQTGQTLGDSTKDTDHLLSHLDEGYVVGSLIFNAMKEDGLSDEQMGFWYHMGRKDGQSFALARIRKLVVKYLQRRLLVDINVR
jgi:hypothetical protein